MQQPATSGPLTGVVVVELGDSASAPFAGEVLAELGAEVWKVERPSGDSARGWGPGTLRGSGIAFHALDRGKRSLTVDIKDPAQLARLRALVAERADVFLHNLRPGASAGYGLDATSLRESSPDLIHFELGAFGDPGPLDTLPGYDPLMQAFSAIMSVTGEEGQAPVRAGVSIIDFGAGLWAVIGILAALYRRAITREGAAVAGSLLETALAWMRIPIANYKLDGEPGARHGSGVAIIVPHRAYECADGGFLVVSSANDVLFARLCTALDRPDWAVDERFVTNAARLRHRDEIDGLIGERLRADTRDAWQDRLQASGIPVAPVQTVAEIAEHPQTEALGIVTTAPDDDVAMVGLPLRFDGLRPAVDRRAPDLDPDGRRGASDSVEI